MGSGLATEEMSNRSIAVQRPQAIDDAFRADCQFHSNFLKDFSRFRPADDSLEIYLD